MTDNALALVDELQRAIRKQTVFVRELTAERDQLKAQESMRLEALRELARLRVDEPVLRARIAELEERVAIAEANGSQLRARAADLADLTVELETDAATLRARVSKLDAPPVVPEGWEVERNGEYGWLLWAPGNRVAVEANSHTGIQVVTNNLSCPVDALDALLYAGRTNQRPPHAGDEP